MLGESSPPLETSLDDNSGFTKQRDFLIQEIAEQMQKVTHNLARLNQLLSQSVQVGKGFEDVGKTWSNYYNQTLLAKNEGEIHKDIGAPNAESGDAVDVRDPV